MPDVTYFWVRAIAALIACICGWSVVFWIMSYAPPMQTSKPHIAAAAGIGALLPFVPDLVALIPSLPPVVGNALCAVILAVAYSLVPKAATKASEPEAK